jgi:hypothetical protein
MNGGAGAAGGGETAGCNGGAAVAAVALGASVALRSLYGGTGSHIDDAGSGNADHAKPEFKQPLAHCRSSPNKRRRNPPC